MILLLGANGYIGQAFARSFRSRGDEFIPLSRDAFDYTRFELLFDYVRQMRPSLVINAASFSGPTDDDARRSEMFRINTILPEAIARVCVVTNTPWGHVSTGSIFSGAKLFVAGKIRVVSDLNRPELRKVLDRPREELFGFTELDEPNCSFESPPCDFYSGTRALAEQALLEYGGGYIWRLQLPFNECNDRDNWLTQLQRAGAGENGINSASHLEDCVGACIELWERQASFGIYNVVNPGTVTTSQVRQLIQRILKPAPQFACLEAPAVSKTPPSGLRPPNCVLDCGKLKAAGIVLRSVDEALEESLERWRSTRVPALRPLNPSDTSIGLFPSLSADSRLADA